MRNRSSSLPLALGLALLGGCGDSSTSDDRMADAFVDGSVTSVDAAGADASGPDGGVAGDGAVGDADVEGGSWPAPYPDFLGLEDDPAVRVVVPAWLPPDEPFIGRVDIESEDASPVVELIAAPTGMTLEADGELSWDPTAVDAGAHVLTVRMTDALGQHTSSVGLVIPAFQEALRATVSAAAGGTFDVTDPASAIAGARLIVPAGAVAEDTEIAVSIPDINPPGIDTVAIELSPSGLELAESVTLELPYEGELPEGWREDFVPAEQYFPYRLATGEYDQPHFIPVHATADTTRRRVVVALEHFSTYRLAGAGGCEREEHRAGPFRIFYYVGAAGCDVVPSDVDWGARGGGQDPNVTYTANVPDFVEDLARALELSYAQYETWQYPLASSYTFTVEDLPVNKDGEASSPRSGIIDIDIPDPYWLSVTAAHEVFHMVQIRASHTVPLLGMVKLMRKLFLVEAPAAFMGHQVFPMTEPRAHPYFAVGQGSDIPLSEADYNGFPVFSFLETLGEYDLLAHWYSGANPGIRDIGWFEDQLEFFYREVDQLFANDDDVWHGWALGFQYFKRDEYVQGMNLWRIDPEHTDLTPQVETSCDGTETMTDLCQVSAALGIRSTLGFRGPVVPGGVVTYAVDVRAAVLLHPDPSLVDIVLPISAPAAATWRVHAGSQAGLTELDDGQGSGEIRVGLDDLLSADHVVVTVFNRFFAGDPPQPVRLDAWFDGPPLPPPPTQLFGGSAITNQIFGLPESQLYDGFNGTAEITLDQPHATTNIDLNPRGLAFDGSGNLWLTSCGGTEPQLLRYDRCQLDSALSTPNPAVTIDIGMGGCHAGLAFDATGRLWVVSTEVVVLEPSELTASGSVSPRTVGISGVLTLAFAPSGDLWTVESQYPWLPDPSTLSRYAAADLEDVAPVPVQVWEGAPLTGPLDIDFDADGTMWITNTWGDDLLAFDAAAQAMSTMPPPTRSVTSSALNHPHTAAFDGDGNLWVGNDYVQTTVMFSAASIAAGGDLTPAITLGGPGIGSANTLAVFPPPAPLEAPSISGVLSPLECMDDGGCVGGPASGVVNNCMNLYPNDCGAVGQCVWLGDIGGCSRCPEACEFCAT